MEWAMGRGHLTLGQHVQRPEGRGFRVGTHERGWKKDPMARHVVELARADLTGAEREGERRLAVLFGAGDEGLEPAEPARPPAWLWPGPTWSRPCVRGARRGGGGPSGSHLGVAPGSTSHPTRRTRRGAGRLRCRRRIEIAEPMSRFHDAARAEGVEAARGGWVARLGALKSRSTPPAPSGRTRASGWAGEEDRDPRHRAAGNVGSQVGARPPPGGPAGAGVHPRHGARAGCSGRCRGWWSAISPTGPPFVGASGLGIRTRRERARDPW